MRILVTGASGFIGSAFIRKILNPNESKPEQLEDCRIIAMLRMTDMRNLRRLDLPYLHEAEARGRLLRRNGDLLGDLTGVCEGVDAVVNFAAKTFVDHSIRDPKPFLDANMLGTYNLLEDARKCGVKRFIQISTDEVYGAILEGAYKEDAPLNPTNPYAASKAAADCLAISYAHTFHMHTTITRTENNYGPYQHRQKAIPTFIRTAMNNELLPVYGDGMHVRQWLWMEDHVDAVAQLLTTEHSAGQIFHVAGSQECTNLDLAIKILKLCGKPTDRIKFIEDRNIRPGHDRRYALVCDKMKQIGWEPKVPLEEGLQQCVNWYIKNQWWVE